MSGVRSIRLYKNRRLYDCDAHCYITHENLKHFLEQGLDLQIREHWSGADCTHRILIELLLGCESEAGADSGSGLVTAEFLRQLIRIRSTFDPLLVRAFLDHTLKTLTVETPKGGGTWT